MAIARARAVRDGMQWSLIRHLLRTNSLREKINMCLSRTLQNVVLSSVCVFSALPAQAAANLLINGGFEHPSTSFVNYLAPGGFTWIDGWITTGNGVHWMTESLGYFTDPTGKDAVDLADYAKANGGIKQSFATTIGALYSVSFAGMTYQNAGNPDGLGEITALIDNVEIQTYQLVNKSSASNAWQNFSFSFTATSALTTLEFRHKPAGENYSFLNDASVFAVPVPEPESWAMLLAGLGLVGFAVRRRTR